MLLESCKALVTLPLPPHASILWERYHDPSNSWRNLPISWIVFSSAFSLPLFSNTAAPVSMPSLRRQYPWIRKSSPTSLPLSSACPPRPWPRLRAETRPARTTSCKATLSGCLHYRPPWPLAILFSKWTLEQKGSTEPPSVVEEALKQDGP